MEKPKLASLIVKRGYFTQTGLVKRLDLITWLLVKDNCDIEVKVILQPSITHQSGYREPRKSPSRLDLSA